jgi:hypothetical protein
MQRVISLLGTIKDLNAETVAATPFRGTETNQSFVPTELLFVARGTIGSYSGNATWNFGFNASNYDNIVSASTATSDLATGECIRVQLMTAKKPFIPANTTPYLNITTAATNGGNCRWDVYLYGYYIKTA